MWGKQGGHVGAPNALLNDAVYEKALSFQGLSFCDWLHPFVYFTAVGDVLCCREVPSLMKGRQLPTTML